MLMLELLEGVKDPRRPQGQRYKLSPLLASLLLAVLSGATSFRKMAVYMALQRERLNTLFGTEWTQTPSYGAIRDFLHGLDVGDMEQLLRNHAQSLPADPDSPALEKELRWIALDGKALRGSAERVEDNRARQIVSVFAQKERLVLGQCEIDEKTNEIPVVQQLMADLGLAGCLYTADALHCQKNA